MRGANNYTAFINLVKLRMGGGAGGGGFKLRWLFTAYREAGPQPVHRSWLGGVSRKQRAEQAQPGVHVARGDQMETELRHQPAWRSERGVSGALLCL